MRIVENFDLSLHNSYKISAICKRAFFPENEEDIRSIYSQYADSQKIIIGSGHNIILSKEYYDEDFIIFSNCFKDVTIEDANIKALSGINLLELSKLALENQLSGLEIFYDIPSSLGGAVVMNAGANGEDIKNLLIETRYFDPTSETFHSITKEDINFEYRNSFFQRNPHLIITEVSLKLKKGNKADILDKMQTTKIQRWAKQPRDFPNAGSVFKRPEGYFVGAIMDDLGLKGFALGGAKISEKHGGFIVNHNQATGRDILALIAHVQNKVKEKYGFELEVEQRII
ncbi:UDP-N-acetylenolpyruvoylglucosamine reductase [compost metagenome]